MFFSISQLTRGPFWLFVFRKWVPDAVDDSVIYIYVHIHWGNFGIMEKKIETTGIMWMCFPLRVVISVLAIIWMADASRSGFRV